MYMSINRVVFLVFLALTILFPMNLPAVERANEPLVEKIARENEKRNQDIAIRVAPVLVSDNGQSFNTRIALADQQIQSLQEENAKMRQQLERSAKSIKSLWIIKLARFLDGWLALFSSAAFVFFSYKKIRSRLGEEIYNRMKEQVTKDVIAYLHQKYAKKIPELIDYQFKQAKQQVMARDKKIHLLGNEEEAEFKKLKKSITDIGFNNITTSLDDAGLVVVVGGEFCNDAEIQQKLIDTFQGKVVPVIFFSGKERVKDLAIMEKFELATPANSMATTLGHLQNLAHLATRV